MLPVFMSLSSNDEYAKKKGMEKKFHLRRSQKTLNAVPQKNIFICECIRKKKLFSSGMAAKTFFMEIRLC